MNSACGEGVQIADNFADADADVIDERCLLHACSPQIKHFASDLGCFSDVDIRIDTASGGGPADYEVTFQVTELGRARGTINTMVGNQEGSLLTGLAAPNLLGMRMRARVFASLVSMKCSKTGRLQASPYKKFRACRVLS